MGNCWACQKPGNRYASTRLIIPLHFAFLSIHLQPDALLVRFWWGPSPNFRAVAQWMRR